MKNSEFKIGSHITVYGNRGIVTCIEKCKEYNVSFNGKVIGNGKSVFTEETYKKTLNNGYTLEETGRTATYFNVSFVDEDLKGTVYDGGCYGCLDEFENYGTW